MREVKGISRIYPEDGPLFLVIDLFCGFGGTSTGYDDAELFGNKIVKVIAAVNHDPKAIKSHWLNHPDVKHFEEDIRTLELTPLTKLVNHYRKLYPNAKVILWASLECTHFSRAKGGQARMGDSRSLANHLPRYQEAIDPDYIKIENVTEFRSWGPLDKNGKPVSKTKGRYFIRWKNQMCKLGYYDEWIEMNSADYGAYTSRNRLFGCFARNGLPIVWPTPTHAKRTAKKDLFPGLKPWNAVKHVLNFSDEGESIFTRKKPLSDNTLERIYAGLLKYVANGDKGFISKYYSGRSAGKQSLVQPEFLAAYYGTGANVSSVHSPCPTLRTKDTVQLIQPKFSYNIQGYDQPAGAIMPKDKHSLVETTPFIFNPSHGGHCTSTEKPCPVIVARQDKAPLYLVKADNGKLSVAVFEGDSEIMIKIKTLMSELGLSDVKMRMLRVYELLKIQGFPENYQMVGSQTDHKKFIGNSVHPLVPKYWAETMGEKLIDNLKIKVA